MGPGERQKRKRDPRKEWGNSHAITSLSLWTSFKFNTIVLGRGLRLWEEITKVHIRKLHFWGAGPDSKIR